MHRAILATISAALLAPLPAVAAMPAHIERREDLRRIIYLPALDRLGPIDRIERTGPYSWRVTAGDCTLDIHMIERRLRPGMPGAGRIPPTWEPRAQRPVCRPR